MADDGGGGGNRGRHQMGAPTAALAAFEVAIARAGRPLAGAELVWVHGQAHGTAGLSPVEAGVAEDLVEPLRFGLGLHPARARHDEGAHAVGDPTALRHCRSGAKILDSAVGAAADEDGVDGDLAHRRTGGEAHVGERSGCGLALDRVGEIHLGGHDEDSDDHGAPLLIDSHGRAVVEPVWALLDYTLARSGARPVLIEWDSDIPGWPVLEAEAARATRALAGIGQSVPA